MAKKSSSKVLDNIADRLKNLNEALEDLARRSAEFAQTAYGGEGKSITTSYEMTDNGFSITAEGEGVVFAEFGTGIGVDESQDNGLRESVQNSGIEIAPGSWSMDEDLGKGTWKAWADSHDGNMSGYPYNRVPKNAMWQTRQFIESEIYKVVDEALNGK